jgi:hypothetical protein
MKLLVPALSALLLSGCTQTLNTHREDFSPSKGRGAWTDYYKAVKKGETPEPPKEKK